jgi:predicted MFS family arabinose efflux permease
MGDGLARRLLDFHSEGTPLENNPVPVSAWDPLRRPVFRSLWTAALVSNIGSWMQTMGAGWLMTELTHSPVKVALVQAAQSLPMFLLALPAGALADIVDRRRQLIASQLWMLSFAALLAATTFAGLTTPWWLLLMTFLIGCGAATMTPAWSASVQEWVPRTELQPAIALIALSINLSRALGPALAGVIVVLFGTATVFLLNALSFLAVIFALLRWKRLPTVVGMPAERLFGALRSGFRYARHAPLLQRVLLRALVFFPFGSVVWALLPIIVSREMQGGASLYGVLLGCIGMGAVAGALLMPRVQARIARDRLVAYATFGYALTCGLLAAVPDVRVAGLALLLGGASWVAILASLQVAAQTALPPWVRARGLAMYWVVLMGGMTAGSVGWGYIADHFGIPWALAGAAVCLAAGVFASLRLRIGTHDAVDLTPSNHWGTPMPAGQPELDAGPVLVTVEYRIASENVVRFLKALRSLRRVRLRDGAVYWQVFRDMAQPERFVEHFVTETWAEHLRQHGRVTVADRDVQERIVALHAGGERPRVVHYLAGYASPEVLSTRAEQPVPPGPVDWQG